MAGKKVKVSVIAETKKFSRAFKNLTNEAGLSKLSATLRTFGKQITVATAAIGAGFTALGVKTLGMAADLEQSTGAIEDVFKSAGNQMKQFANTAATSVGLSKHSYQELAVLLGSQLKNAGTPLDQLGDKTNNLIVLASDLSAMFGGDTKDAVNALSSALKGERDPIERYGVSLKQAAIDAKALELGFQKTKNGFSQEAQAAATLALIYEQTADAKGKFAREGNTMAHQLQVLKASFQTFAETAGTAVLPFFTEAAAALSAWLLPKLEALGQWVQTVGVPTLKTWAANFKKDILPTVITVAGFLKTHLIAGLQNVSSAFSVVVPKIRDFAHWVNANKSWLIPLAAAVTTFVGSLMAYVKVTKLIMATKAAFGAARAAVIAFNLAMAANPLGAVALVITTIIAAIAAWLATNEEARAKIAAAWNWIVESAAALWEQAKAIFWAGVQAVVDAWTWLKDSVTLIINTAVAKFWEMVDYVTSIPGRIWNGIKTLATILQTAASNAWTNFKNGTISGFLAVYNYVTSIPTKILNAIGDLGSLLWNAGSSVIQGFLDGISSMFGKVKDKLGALTSWLPDWKGPAKRDAVILRKSGQLVIGGFIDGLQDQYGNVRKSLRGFTDSLSMDVDLTPRINGVRNAPLTAAASTGQTVININLATLSPTYETGRQIAQAIQRYESMNGARR